MPTRKTDRIPGDSIVYKRCRPADLMPAIRLVLHTLNHLRRATGKKPIRPRLKKVPPIWRHLYRQDRRGFWGAWHNGHLVGLAAAIQREKQWYLAYLFVHPKYQDRKIGRLLLEKVWCDGPEFSHSLTTFTFNMRAVGLYSQLGMVPICGLPLMSAGRSRLRLNGKPALAAERSIDRYDLTWITALEKRVRGYRRPQEWGFWKNRKDVTINIFRAGRKRVGYSLVSDDGLIGPAGAVSDKYLVQVIDSTIKTCPPKKGKEFYLWCPTINMRLYRYLIETGFRCREMELFMSDKDYADFKRYVPAMPAVF